MPSLTFQKSGSPSQFFMVPSKIGRKPVSSRGGTPPKPPPPLRPGCPCWGGVPCCCAQSASAPATNASVRFDILPSFERAGQEAYLTLAGREAYPTAV